MYIDIIVESSWDGKRVDEYWNCNLSYPNELILWRTKTKSSYTHTSSFTEPVVLCRLITHTRHRLHDTRHQSRRRTIYLQLLHSTDITHHTCVCILLSKNANPRIYHTYISNNSESSLQIASIYKHINELNSSEAQIKCWT